MSPSSMEARRLAMTALISISLNGMSSASFAASSGYFSNAESSAIASLNALKTSGFVA